MTVDRLPIAVIGAGNLGLAQAGHLVSLGHEVRLYNRHAARLSPFRAGGRLRLHGAVDATVAFARVTDDLVEALAGARLVFVDTPASAHAELADALKTVLRADADALVLLHPGQTLGAREFAVRLGIEAFPRLGLGELQTAIYTSRVGAPGEVNVLAIKQHVAIAAYPGTAHARLGPVQALYPQLLLEPSTLTTAVANVQSFIHPAVCLMNATRIERGESFRIYRQGLTEAVGRVFEACDAERLALARSLGQSVPTAAAWFERCYGVQAPTAIAAMQAIPAYAELLAPTSLQTRLLSEDVPTGLVPLVDLARVLGVPTPNLSGLLAFSETVLGQRARGRTLEALGLAGLDGEQLRARL